MASWEQLGELANVGQLVGLNAGQLIGLIVQAANTARMHRRNCRHFAHHLKLIGNLLEQLKISELKKYPETREPLEQLEDALRRSYVLVDSCQNRSYLYLLAMGWNIVYQFRRAQNEIDRYLKIIPLITLVDNARIRERLGSIERDEHEYTLDEQYREMKDAILERDPAVHDMALLKKSLSCSYPNTPFHEALKKEKEKLQMELHRSNTNRDVGQLEVIQRLIHVTETVSSTLEEECKQNKSAKKLEADHPGAGNRKENAYSENDLNRKSRSKMTARSASPISSDHDVISYRRSDTSQDWHTDLLGCFSEPYLCCRTIFYPCGTISQIASAAKNQTISPAEVCNDLMAYSLLLSCCCYTCCVRRQLRKVLNIKGGYCDDFLSHVMCCCCALVQEWREVEIRELRGSEMTKSTPPASQYMEKF